MTLKGGVTLNGKLEPAKEEKLHLSDRVILDRLINIRYQIEKLEIEQTRLRKRLTKEMKCSVCGAEVPFHLEVENLDFEKSHRWTCPNCGKDKYAVAKRVEEPKAAREVSPIG